MIDHMMCEACGAFVSMDLAAQTLSPNRYYARWLRSYPGCFGFISWQWEEVSSIFIMSLCVTNQQKKGN